MSKRRQLVLEDYQRMHLPKKFWDAETNLLGKNNQKIVKKYLSAIELDSSLGLIMEGLPGVGKTYIASIIVKELRRLANTVLYLPYYDVNWVSLKEDFDDDIGTLSDRIKNVDILFLDGYDSDRKKNDVLLDLLRHRVNNYKPILMTFRPDAIEFDDKGRTDDRVFNVVSTTAFHVRVKGEDKRDLERKKLSDIWKEV